MGPIVTLATGGSKRRRSWGTEAPGILVPRLAFEPGPLSWFLVGSENLADLDQMGMRTEWVANLKPSQSIDGSHYRRMYPAWCNSQCLASPNDERVLYCNPRLRYRGMLRLLSRPNLLEGCVSELDMDRGSTVLAFQRGVVVYS